MPLQDPCRCAVVTLKRAEEAPWHSPCSPPGTTPALSVPSVPPAFCPSVVPHAMPACPCPLGPPLGSPPCAPDPQQALGCAEGTVPPGSPGAAHQGAPAQGREQGWAGQSSSWHRGGKFVKKVLNTDFPGYQKENLCIAFEFNFSIKAFSL